MPDNARPAGVYDLDIVFQTIYEHWRDGKQIVFLLGAGISVQSGYPTLPMLAEHLLTLNAIKRRTLQSGPSNSASSGVGAAAYDLERDGWVPLTRLPEFCPERNPNVQGGSRKLTLELIERQLNQTKTRPADFHFLDQASDNELFQFADYSLGLNWLQLMEMIADNRPHLVDSTFLSLGAMPSPGPAHNFLAHCISLFNVRLVLTTNFDTLIEQTLQREGYDPMRFDIHTSSPPPSHNQVKRQMSIVKLHGSNYGLRADRSINAPLETGHLQTLLEYFEDDTLLLCLDYGGNDARVMGLIRQLVARSETKSATKKDYNTTVIRVDGMVSGETNAFRQLAQSSKAPIHNLFYPPPGLFLLHLYQYASGNLPLSRRIYPTVIHSPAPHGEAPSLGMSMNSPSSGLPPLESEPRRTHDELAHALRERMDGHESHHKPLRVALVAGAKGSGVSHTLSQVYEHFYTSHQLFWCDFDTVTTLGTVVASLYDFVLGRQPNLPRSPLPLTLPHLDDKKPSTFGAAEFADVQRVVDALWERLKRGRYLLVFDSLTTALEKMLEEGGRWQMEARRITAFLGLLLRRASQASHAGHCVLLIGNHDMRKPQRNVLFAKYDEKALQPWEAFLCLVVAPEDPATAMVSWRKDTVLTNSTGEKVSAFDVRKTDCASCHVLLKTPAKSYEYILPPGKPIAASDMASTSRKSSFIKSNLDELIKASLIDADKIYLCFLFDCAWANHPRSWAQILAMPTVEQLENFAPSGVPHFGAEWKIEKCWPEEWDDRSKFAHLLLKKASKDRWLRLQPGGFYYMDGSARSFLRSLSHEENLAPTLSRNPLCPYLKRPPDKKEWDLSRVNRRQMRYYERSLNQSGDMTALQYFYWHGQQLLDLTSDPDERVRVQSEIARGILENTQAARGHLCAYEHCFLLLQLWESLEGSTDDTLQIMRQRAGQALSDLYEDYEDAEGGAQILRARSKLSGRIRLSRPQTLHIEQKISAQRLDYRGALEKGLLALLASEGKVAAKPHNVGKLLEERTALEFTSTNTVEWHQIHLRLIRVLLRVSFLGDPAEFDPKIFNGDTIKKLLNDGRKKLSTLPEEREIKLLWARYYTQRALLRLNDLENHPLNAMTSKTLAYLNWAKSYAKAVQGGLGQTYNAVADVVTAETLIWEGRRRMNASAWPQAAARQEAAIRHLEALRPDLPVGRTSLIWWRELAILQATATADILKRQIQQIHHPTDLASSKACEAFFENFSRTLEQGAFDVQFLSAVIWNDPWRESRLNFQKLRSAWFCCYALSLYYRIIEKAESPGEYAERKSAISASFNRILRAARTWSSAIPLLPLQDEQGSQKFWDNFEADLGIAIYQRNRALFAALSAALKDCRNRVTGSNTPGLGASLQGLYEGAELLEKWFFDDGKIQNSEEFFQRIKTISHDLTLDWPRQFSARYGDGDI